jgi:hypothetical protein
MKKAESFVKQFIALIKGDDAEALAQKVFRQRSAALTAHIAVAKSETLVLEDKLEEAIEAQNSARLNHGNSISDRDNYVASLIIAENNVIEAKENLEAHLEKISFLEKELEIN